MSSAEADRATRLAMDVDATGVVHFAWAPGLMVGEEVARAAVAALDRLNAGQRRPLLVGMAGTAGITREARKVFAQPCSASRIALVGSSAVDRVMANFVLLVTATAVPTRFFTSQASALDWLRDERAVA